MITVNPRPSGLYYLYAAVAGHTFAWYCLYNLFVLWLTQHVGEAVAQQHYGNLGLAAYTLPLLGGAIAARTSPRLVAVVGGLVAVVGYCVVALTAQRITSLTIVALAAIVLGCGLVKPNLSAMVGRLFPSGSEYAVAAFATYYSCLNGGSFGSPLVGGWMAEHVSYGAAFACAVFGELVVVGALLLGRDALAVVETPSSLAALIGPVKTDDATQPQLPKLNSPLAADHIGHAPDVDAHKRAKLIALWVFIGLATVAFWPAYAQNGSGLMLWASKHTDRVMLGYNVPAVWFATINSIICILCAVPLTRLFARLPLSVSTIVGYVLMAASFGTLLAAPTIASHPSWLASAIVLSSLSEVLISTVGLAQVAKLAPRNQISLYMSIWLLTVAIGAKVAGMVGSRLPLRGSFAVLLGLTLIASVATLLLRRRLDVATALAVPPVVFRPTKSTADGVPQHAT